MIDDPLSRRVFLAATCAAVGSGWLLADPAMVRQSLARARRERGLRPPVWEFLSSEQADDVDAIAALIMPTDETPGAREAGVVHFVDHALATWAVQQREPVIHGLEDLNWRANERWATGGRFAALSSDKQTVLLHEVEQTPFFQAMRFFTLVGMFALPIYGGNADKVGWRLIGFDDRHVWEPPFGDYDAEAARQ